MLNSGATMHSTNRLEMASAVSSSTFKANDDRVYAFVEVENPTKTDGTIHVVFEPPTGPALAEIPLKVGETARFRTWAFTRKAHAPGEWAVVVRDGTELS